MIPQNRIRALLPPLPQRRSDDDQERHRRRWRQSWSRRRDERLLGARKRIRADQFRRNSTRPSVYTGVGDRTHGRTVVVLTVLAMLVAAAMSATAAAVAEWFGLLRLEETASRIVPGAILMMVGIAVGDCSALLVIASLDQRSDSRSPIDAHRN